jgi:glycosyltransferase involved in cell wall biosynthesis
MGPQLVEALTLLPRRFRLAFTGGESTQTALRAYSSKFGVEGRITVLPRLDFNQMLSYTVNADAGLLLYSNNDLGNFFTAPGRLTEYLACGIPALASDHTGLENLVLKMQIGACVDSTVPARIAAGIQHLASAKAGGELGRERMRACFLDRLAFDHWEPQVADAFEALASGESRPGPFPRYPWMNGFA